MDRGCVEDGEALPQRRGRDSRERARARSCAGGRAAAMGAPLACLLAVAGPLDGSVGPSAGDRSLLPSTAFRETGLERLR